MQDDNFFKLQYELGLQEIKTLSHDLASAKLLVAEQKAVIQEMQIAQESLADANIRIAELYGELEDAYEKIAQTKEIEQLNSQLREINQEYQAANEELYQTLDTIREQSAMLDSKNQKITSSITYAKRIQQAILPRNEIFSKHVGKDNFFILYLPKDIVSGDFYWIEKSNNQTIISVVDCTGHGIPGAFMSMIGMQLLHEIVLQRHKTLPNEILYSLNIAVRRVLRQEETMNKDGMEMMIIAIDKEKKQVLYSGAMNPLFYIEHQQNLDNQINNNPNNEQDNQADNQLIEIKATKRPIGGYETIDDISYELHTLNLNKPATFYLTTDGFQDQFGGNENRKFMAKKFKDLLLQTSKLPIAKQHEVLANEIQTWKNRQEQTDDITVMGIYIDFN